MKTEQNRRVERLTDLRQRADLALHLGLERKPSGYPQDVENLLHELQVYQMELEAQNEALRQAQVQLSESRDQYSELYDHAPVGYMTVGVNGLIEQSNLTSATLLGAPKSKLIKHPLSRFIVFDDQDLLYHHRRSILAEPQITHTVELRMLPAIQVPFYAQLDSKAIVNALGVVSGFRTIVSDISVRKENEATLQTNQQLTSALRNLHTTQQATVQQERLAAVGQLAAGIAHDFNNILAIINNYSTLLLQQANLDTSGREKLIVINSQVKHASRLVNQILDFSRNSTSDKQVIDVGVFLSNIVELLSHTLPENIQLTFHKPQENCLVSGDITQLQQVMINLIGNARDAIVGKGMVQIDLQAMDIDTQRGLHASSIAAGEWVTIRVTDNGPGIPQEVLPYIFEPFFTTKGGKGSGLGLAQVYGLIKQHGGEVEVVTQVGKGTQFMLYLPRLSSTHVPIEPEILAAPSEPKEASLLSTGNGTTILVVDDNMLLGTTTAEFLEFVGYHVFTVASGEEAIQLYQQYQEKIVLVITDLSMPTMNGIELANRLRQTNPRLKIIISTGFQSDAVTKSHLVGGDAIWLQKPYSMHKLAEIVAKQTQSNA